MGLHGNLTQNHIHLQLPHLSIPLTMIKRSIPPYHPNYLTHMPPAPPVPHPVSRSPTQRRHLTRNQPIPNPVSILKRHNPWKLLHDANLMTCKRASRNANGTMPISSLDSTLLTPDSATKNPPNDSRAINRTWSTTDKIKTSRTPNGRKPYWQRPQN